MSEVRGKLIVLEGLEGAGKSTAMSFIKQYFAAKNIEFISTREPGGTFLGDTVRQLIKEIDFAEPLEPKAELLLFYAARVQLLEQVIRPALAQGTWVIADRFELSSYAYQAAGRQLGDAAVQQLSDFCVQGLRADLTLFLDVPPEKGMQRAKRRGKTDRIEQESEAFFSRVYQGYHKHLPAVGPVCLIDACKPLQEVQAKIYAALNHFLDNVSA